MKSIGLISDTHGYQGEDVVQQLEDVDEIWHVGDVGNIPTLHFYSDLGKDLRVVWGNIDDHDVRRACQKHVLFELEGVRVLMIHIGGYPGRYSREAYHLLKSNPCDLFISGHSHILKVIRDKTLNLLHMNPGACGIKGLHKVRTMLKFDLEKGTIKNVRVIELGRRGKSYLT